MRILFSSVFIAGLSLSACGGDKAEPSPTQNNSASVPLRADAPVVLKTFTDLCSLAAEDGLDASASSAQAQGISIERNDTGDTQSFGFSLLGADESPMSINVSPVKTTCSAFLKADIKTPDATAYIKAVDGLEGFRGRIQTVNGPTPSYSGFYNGDLSDGRVIVLSASGEAKGVVFVMIVAQKDDLQ